MYKKLSYIPYDFILKNINASYVDNYITYMKDFEKNILKKSCLISMSCMLCPKMKLSENRRHSPRMMSEAVMVQ